MILFTERHRGVFRIAALALWAATTIPATAHAGFQWVTPLEQPAPATPTAQATPETAMPMAMQLPTAMPAAPVVQAAPEPMMPVSMPLPAAPPPVPAAPAVQVVPEPAMPMPMQLPTATHAAPPVVAAIASPVMDPPAVVEAETDKSAVIEGFGKKIPLTVALKQILPPHYGFSLAKGVNRTAPVDWQGGKPWRTVLREALAPAGLIVRESNQVVKILPAGSVVAASMTTAFSAKTKNASVVPMPAKIDDAMLASAAAPTLAPPAPPSALPVAAPEPPPLPPVVMPAEPPPAETAAAPVARDGMLVNPTTPLMPMPQAAADSNWTAEPGEQLRAVIKRWAARAHVELVWATEYDYPIQASVNFSGSFEDAVRSLLTGFVDAKPQPFGRLHDNPAAGQRILVVEARGNTGND